MITAEISKCNFGITNMAKGHIDGYIELCGNM